MKRIFSCLLFLLSACSLEEKVEEKALYYDLQGLLTEVQAQLQQQNVQLWKTVRFQQNSGDTLLVLDSAALKQELDVFREADINRPVLQGRYTIDSVRDKGLLKIRYVAEAPGDMAIDTLEVWLRQEAQPTRFRAHFSDKNPLYQSERVLMFWFQEAAGLPLPEGYQISGRQHMIFQDTVNYRVAASFRYE